MKKLVIAFFLICSVMLCSCSAEKTPGESSNASSQSNVTSAKATSEKKNNAADKGEDASTLKSADGSNDGGAVPFKPEGETTAAKGGGKTNIKSDGKTTSEKNKTTANQTTKASAEKTETKEKSDGSVEMPVIPIN